jgi:type IV secretory pathway TrbF-like protein
LAKLTLYNRNDLRRLRVTLDERWAPLPADDAERWVQRYAEQRSPYRRIRSHVIRVQLDAIVALADNKPHL